MTSPSTRASDCFFCNHGKERVVAKNELGLALRDTYPVTEHHTLIVPRRHVADFFDLTPPEAKALHALLHEAKQEIEALDETVTGFNIGVNCGADAGQSVFHVHLHLIPRRHGDMENPKGGVRGVIPDKRIY